MSELIPEFDVWPLMNPVRRGSYACRYEDTYGKLYRPAYRQVDIVGQLEEIEGMVDFDDIAANIFRRAAGIAQKIVRRQDSMPGFAEDLKIVPNSGMAHKYMMHFDYIPALFDRVIALRAAQGIVFDYKRSRQFHATHSERELGVQLLAERPLFAELEGLNEVVSLA